MSTQVKIFPYTYYLRELTNGLRVIVIPTDSNIVSIQIPVCVGSRNEVEEGKSGFAHFFEHCMFRGSQNISGPEYTKIVTKTGADQNAYTTDDFTNYHSTFIKDDLETFIHIEADRFQFLQYSEENFKTEALAVLGEYNKAFSNPMAKMQEIQRDNAYTTHTYKHTTMGYIKDIEDMPNGYKYSHTFFERFYTPSRTTLIIAGGTTPEVAFPLVEKYWSGWKSGAPWIDNIPQEPEPKSVYKHIPWDTDTLPIVTVAFHGPSYSNTKIDKVTIDVISQLCFSSASPLYKKLVIEEQVVDTLDTDFPDRVDSSLMSVYAIVKDINKVWYVRDQILQTFAQLRWNTVPIKDLKSVVSNLRYKFTNKLDNPEAIAEAMVESVWSARDPESLNKKYALLEKVSPEDVEHIANTYFTDKRQVVVTLSKEPLPPIENPLGSVDNIVSSNKISVFPVRGVFHKSESPLISLRLVFKAGSAFDGQNPGLAYLTASLITKGGSTTMRYDEIQKALFPMAAQFSAQVDKEMTAFIGRVNKETLMEFYNTAIGQLLNPAWDADDFIRVRDEVLNSIKVSLRGNNDEELGKEVLQERIYYGTPYGTLNLGHIRSLENITIDNVKEFYRVYYTLDHLTFGASGDISEEFLKRFKTDLSLKLVHTRVASNLPPFSVPTLSNTKVTIIKKDTRATAISFGFPIPVIRSHPDFPALWLLRSFLGEHRSFAGLLMNRMREIRGLNYGDYAYNEYFPNGMFLGHPEPNLARLHQIFEIWIRPVQPHQAHYSLRLAKFELDKLVRNGISQNNFEQSRGFLLKFMYVLVKTQDAKLGYSIDSQFYNIPEFTEWMKLELEKLTVEDVNRVAKKYLNCGNNFHVVVVTKDAESLRDQLVSGAPSPIVYDTTRPEEILSEDKEVEVYPLITNLEDVTIVSLEDVFV